MFAAETIEANKFLFSSELNKQKILTTFILGTQT